MKLAILKNNPITFSAEIQQHQDINAAFVNFPFDTVELFGKKGQVKPKFRNRKKEYFSILISNCVAVEKNKR